MNPLISNQSRMVGLMLLGASVAWTQGPPTQTMTSKIGDFRDGFLWILNAQGNGQYQPGTDHVAPYGGLTGDLPIAGNWNGAACTQYTTCYSPGIYRASTQYFLLDTNGNFIVDAGDQYFNLNIPSQSTDIPVSGDWNGNGKTKVGLFRPSTCEWFLDYDGDGVWNSAVDKHYTFGGTSCIGVAPVVGDWTGSGTSKIGVYWSSPFGNWAVDSSGNGNWGYIGSGATQFNFGHFGGVPDIPVVGDWYGTSSASDVGVLQSDSIWLLDASGNRQFDSADIQVTYGGSAGNNDIPVVGNWTHSVPPVNATPDSFIITVSGTGQGSNGSAAPGKPAQFAFTFHDVVNGANAINGGQVYLQDTSGNMVCYFYWYLNYARAIYANLYDSYSQSDSYCTIAPVSMTYSSSDPSLATMTINITATSAMNGLYTVDSLVTDSMGGNSSWGQAGTFTVIGPLTLNSSTPSDFGVVGTPISLQYSAQGGTPPYNWNISGNPPAGLMLTPSGSSSTLSGTPTSPGSGVAGTPQFTITLNDAANNTASAINQFPVLTPDDLKTPSLSSAYPSKEYIPFNNRVIAIETTSPQVQMTATKVGVYRNGNAFLLDTNGNGAYDAGVDKYINTFLTGNFNGVNAAAGDIGVSGDWLGDSSFHVGVYRPSTGQWFIDANGNGVYDSGDYTYTYGGLTTGGNVDTPVVGDWTGQGRSCIGISRNNGTGVFWLLDLNCNGSFDNTPTDAFFPFGGIPGDLPVVGAWTGATTRVGVVRKYYPPGCTPATGSCPPPLTSSPPFYWVLDAGTATAGNTPANHPPLYDHLFAFGGLLNDVFVTGDWYATGTSMAGIYRAGLWVLDAAFPGDPQALHLPGFVFGYGGLAFDMPVTGSW
jgi:hypothetical protein